MVAAVLNGVTLPPSAAPTSMVYQSNFAEDHNSSNTTNSSVHDLLNKPSFHQIQRRAETTTIARPRSSSSTNEYPAQSTASSNTLPQHLAHLHQQQQQQQSLRHQYSSSFASTSTSSAGSSYQHQQLSMNGHASPNGVSHPHHHPNLMQGHASSSSADSLSHGRSPSNSDSLASASGLTTPASTNGSSVGGARKISPPHSHYGSLIPRQFLPPLDPRHYTILKEMGDGSFGTVWLADWHSELKLPPGTLPPGPSNRPEYKGKKLVALKRMKKAFEGGWEECVKLKELKSLQQIPMHPNIIPLYDAFLLPSSKELYFVFECMEGNLYQLTKSRKGRALASGLVASIFEQILAGLDHIHRSGYFHRDMKPENLLITTTGLADYPASSLYATMSTPPEKDVVVTVKLADFGLARETASRPPYTEYVSTRWYRAPEVLLRSRDYSNPVDMWALGTILVEVLTLKPIFPGDSEVDQVFKICEILGDPSTDYGVDEKGKMRGGGLWPRGVRMAKDVGFAFPKGKLSKIPPRTFASLFDASVVPAQLIDCIADLLRFEPRARLTTQQCLDHAYFREIAYRYAPYRAPGSSVSNSGRTTPSAYPTAASPVHTAYPTPPSLLGLSISTSSAASTPLSLPSPRVIPPAHGNGTPSYFKPPFAANGDARPLPPADPYASSSNGPSPDSAPHLQSHYSDGSSSNVSGLSNYSVQVNGAVDQPMAAFPDGVSDRQHRSPSISSNWSGPQDPNSWGMPSISSMPHLHPSATFPRSAVRPGQPNRRPSFSGSVAASTFYDGSVFEGVAGSRASSIMSFPVNYTNFDNSPSPTFPDSPSSVQTGNSGADAYAAANKTPSIVPSRQQRPNLGLGLSSSPAQAAPVKSSRWSISKVFSNDHSNDQQANSQHSLKRTPSVSSSLNGHSPMEGVTSTTVSSSDAKKDRKQAEKAARDAEKAKRDAAMAASRDRARAVMKKKNQLREAADPLHNFSNAPPSAVAPDHLDVKGKGRASSDTMTHHHANTSQASFMSKMQPIVEDTSRLYVSNDLRHKTRRRDEDDDVHSVSSNETGHSSQHRGRAYSISGVSVSSVATSASDPERRMRYEQLQELGLTRVPSLSSLNSTMSAPARQTYAPSQFVRTGTGHSSLESSLVRQMNGLATSARGGEVRSESRGARASSPRDPHHERYSPYPFPAAAGSSASLPRQSSSSHHSHQLPPISSFDSNAIASSATSIQSFATAPIIPSHLNPTRPSPPPNS